MTDQIIGAGGGQSSAGGSQKAAKDNLDSRQVARIVDLLSEGEIEGFATPSRLGIARSRTIGQDPTRYERELLKDIFLNNTPMVRTNADVSTALQESDKNFQFNYNDKERAVSPRYGEGDDQDPLDEVSQTIQEEVAVGVVVEKQSDPAAGVTRTITDTSVTAVRVTLSLPQLQRFKANGDVVGTHVQYKIMVSYNGGAFQEVVNDTIRGRTVDLYQRKKYFNLDTTQSKPVQIRVIRITDNDSDRTPSDDSFNSALTWTSFTEHTFARLTHSFSGLVGHVIDAKQFSSIPERKYRIRGIKVKIPSNATVDAETGRLTYSDTWDGTFAATNKWTTDPAWILYDLLTSRRYGFGDHILYEDIEGNEKARLNKFNFFDCSQYCSALVPDGFGGQEPRFSCNISIQTQTEAFDLINQMASIFRAQPYWSSGNLALSMDRPQDPELIFTQSNVTEDGFSYSGSSVKTRHTCINVSYLDLDIRDTAYELVEDEDAIRKFGVVKKNVKAVGCTSRGQARRLGEWILYSENRETEMCSFTTRLAEGTKVRPGMIIKVSDPFRANRFRGGRVKPGSTAQVIKVDRTKDQMFPDGAPSTFDFNIMLRVAVSVYDPGTDSSSTQDVVRQVSVGDINSAQWTGDTITLPTSLERTPEPNAVFAIGVSTLRPSLWRVVSVTENDDATFAVTALVHETGKYDHVERDVPLQARDVTELDNPAAEPTNLTASELLYEANGQVFSKIILSWQPGADTARSIVRWRYDDGNPNEFPTFANDYEILNTTDGKYEFEVFGQSAGFKNSPIAELTFNALGKTAPPATIPDLTIAPIDQHTAELHWPQSTDLDVRIGGTIRIRHTPVIGASATWVRTNDIVPAVNGSSTRKIVPLVEGTYFIRAVDSTGNESTGTASVVVDLPEPQDLFVAQTYREDDDTPPFQGTGTNMAYNETEDALILAADGLIDDVTDFDELVDLDNFGDTNSSGSYEFLSTLDLGAKYDLELLQTLKTRAFVPTDFWDSRTGLIDTWVDIDGTDISLVNAEMYVRSTNDDPSGSPTYGDWQPFVNGTKRGRGFQFKVDATTSDPAQNIAIEELGVTTKLQRRTEQERNISSGTSAKAITFPAAFYGTPSVGITAQDMDSGDYFQISSVSRTGFTVTFKNSSDTIVSKTFDYQAVGHGREIT
jgi:predicted phage tail protein